MTPINIAEIAVADPPEAWRAAGFAVGPDGVATVGTVRISCCTDGGAGEARARGITGWQLRTARPSGAGGRPGAPGDLDGLPTRWTTGLPPQPAPGDAHPNGAVRIDHVVVMSPDGARTTAAFEAAGLEARRVREAGTDGSPLRQTFFRAGEVIVEVVAPSEPEPTGPVGGAGARFWGLAFTVADLDAAVALLGEACGAAHEAVQSGRRIATVRHRRLALGVPVALMSPPD